MNGTKILELARTITRHLARGAATATVRTVELTKGQRAFIATVTLDGLSREGASGTRFPTEDDDEARAEAFCSAAMKFKSVRQTVLDDMDPDRDASLAREYELEAFVSVARQCGLDPRDVALEAAGVLPEALTSATCLRLIDELKLRLACLHPRRRAEYEFAAHDREHRGEGEPEQ